MSFADLPKGHEAQIGTLTIERQNILNGSGLTAKAEYDEVGSSDINISTLDSRTDIPVAHRRLPSYYSGAKFGPGLCPHWKDIPPIGTYGEGLSDV
jgi:hypothetical protein